MKYFSKAKETDEVTIVEKRNKEIAYEAAVEGIVLLKNDGVLPLKEKKIAAYGSGTAKTIKGGTGSGEVKERHSISILEGLEMDNFEICNKKWIEKYIKKHDDAFLKWKEKAQKEFNIFRALKFEVKSFIPPAGDKLTEEDYDPCDTCIYVVSKQSGEGHDRNLKEGQNDFFEEEIAEIRMLTEIYKKLILVINVGSSINLNSLNDLMDKINAVIFYCQQGMMGGLALAHILSGKKYPSAKLTDTWANNYSDLPFHDEFSYLNADVVNENYKEGIYVGYKYYDSFNKDCRYPFGYGLSYTSFDLAREQVKIIQDKLIIKVNVANTGSYPGKEVVQAYITLPNGTIDKEYKRLVCFKKTNEILEGKSEEVELVIDMKDAASYFEDKASFILEKGIYTIKVGNSSLNTQNYANIEIKEDIIVSKHENSLASNKKIQELVSGKKETETSDITLELKKEAVHTVTYAYKETEEFKDEKVDRILNNLTVKEMVDTVVGDGIAGMFGQKRYNITSGTVGLTTRSLYKKGLINVNLADGPAGLRINPISTINKRGVIKAGSIILEMLEFLPKIAKLVLMGNIKKDKLLYQYATAFPVAMALAQSFNTELLYKVGRAVADEMNEFNITYWLAPGMNIHRNPLCGRNFEYYSEDPYLSGKIASAITKGVQSNEGCYATIKHFCCNNQEENRNYSSSNVDERVVRELYLKGFEIAVREGNAKALMTSYNKLNGIYTPNSYDLVTKILRNEWEFRGVVMTDWYSTGKDKAKADLCIKVGNDLIMPGSASDKKTILKAIKNKTLDIKDLRKASANVIRSIVYSNVSKEISAEMFD